MNWNNGFSARYYYRVVDPNSWRDLEPHDLIGGSIIKTTDSLMESADIELVAMPADRECWVRVWLDARQGESGERIALFTGLMQAPATNWDGTRKSQRAECYSVLKPADDIILSRGWYASAGLNGASLAASLLSVGAAPVQCEDGAPALSSFIVAEDGETNLTMARKILNAIGWRLKISGDGRITICPKPSDIAAVFNPLDNDCVELAVTDTRDWFSCPNIFRAVCDDLSAVARDDDPDSPLSTISRGREIWKEEQSCTLNEGESIEAYAARRLREEQAPARTVTYSRRFLPDVYPDDRVQLHFPAQSIDGVFRIKTQRIELGFGARTAEESEEV